MGARIKIKLCPVCYRTMSYQRKVSGQVCPAHGRRRPVSTAKLYAVLPRLVMGWARWSSGHGMNHCTLDFVKVAEALTTHEGWR